MMKCLKINLLKLMFQHLCFKLLKLTKLSRLFQIQREKMSIVKQGFSCDADIINVNNCFALVLKNLMLISCQNLNICF